VEREKDKNTTLYFAGRPIELGYIYLYKEKMLLIFGAAISVTLLFLFGCFRTARGVFIPFLGGLIIPIHAFFFPYQHAWLIMADGMTGGRGWAEGHRIKVAIFHYVCLIITLLVGGIYWKLIGLI